MYFDINTKNCAQSTMTGASALRDVSQAASLLNQMREAQNETHDVIGLLEVRLSEVLRPVPSQPVLDCGPECPSISPMCDELQCRVDAEHSARHRILALLDRLTV